MAETARRDDLARPRPLLVVGAPRSGTTLLGAYLSSSPDVLALGEYGGFHLAHNIAPSSIGALPGPFRERYLAELACHAQLFADGLATEQECSWYCDATPWNIFAAEQLGKQLEDAVFVLMLRHYSGTVQSLRRSFAGGFTWAGVSWADSAAVWRDCYSAVDRLPGDRTIPVSYDALASDPGPTLAVLRLRLEEHGFDTSKLDLRELTISHAPPVGLGPRPTIGVLTGEHVGLRQISSFDPDSWSGDIQRVVWPVVKDVHRGLQSLFEGVYRCPPAPQRLLAHDEVDGLVRLDLDGSW
jgi:hypothetical protein